MPNDKLEEYEVTQEMILESEYKEALIICALKAISPCTMLEMLKRIMHYLPDDVFLKYFADFNKKDFLTFYWIIIHIFDYNNKLLSLIDGKYEFMIENYFEDFTEEQIDILNKLSREN